MLFSSDPQLECPQDSKQATRPIDETLSELYNTKKNNPIRELPFILVFKDVNKTQILLSVLLRQDLRHRNILA